MIEDGILSFGFNQQRGHKRCKAHSLALMECMSYNGGHEGYKKYAESHLIKDINKANSKNMK